MIQPINTNAQISAAAKSGNTNQVKNTSFCDVLSETQTKEEQEEQVNLDEIFEEASQKYNVPVALLKAVAKQESNFTADAVSKSGAQGIMQLMPATARGLGVEDPFDPKQNIMGGADYLSQMLSRYHGDIKLSLAAYNAGAGNVKKYGGVPPFKETQNYVVKVMQYMKQDLEIPEGQVSVAKKITDANQTPSVRVPSRNTNEYTEAAELSEKEKDEIFSYDDYLAFLKEWENQLALFRMEQNIGLIPSFMNQSVHKL